MVSPTSASTRQPSQASRSGQPSQTHDARRPQSQPAAKSQGGAHKSQAPEQGSRHSRDSQQQIQSENGRRLNQTAQDTQRNAAGAASKQGTNSTADATSNAPSSQRSTEGSNWNSQADEKSGAADSAPPPIKVTGDDTQKFRDAQKTLWEKKSSHQKLLQTLFQRAQSADITVNVTEGENKSHFDTKTNTAHWNPAEDAGGKPVEGYSASHVRLARTINEGLQLRAKAQAANDGAGSTSETPKAGGEGARSASGTASGTGSAQSEAQGDASKRAASTSGAGSQADRPYVTITGDTGGAYETTVNELQQKQGKDQKEILKYFEAFEANHLKVNIVGGDAKSGFDQRTGTINWNPNEAADKDVGGYRGSAATLFGAMTQGLNALSKQASANGDAGSGASTAAGAKQASGSAEQQGADQGGAAIQPREADSTQKDAENQTQAQAAETAG